ncbi:hypothetical protein GCM10029964_050620 [Kibdelosporangium lantanae]
MAGMSDHPWEPPLAGTEADHLLGALDRLRVTFRWKADDLDETGLRARVGASTLSIGGLLRHLAAGEDIMFTRKLDGSTPATRGATGTAAATGRSRSTTASRPPSCTRCGTAPSPGPASGSPPPSPTAASTNRSSWRRAGSACAGWSAT